MKVAGTRRGETYPEPKPVIPPPTTQFVIRQGTDTPLSGLDIPSSATQFPRDILGNPLQVRFPAFTIGDVLEIEAWLSGGGAATSTARAEMEIIVSIDGGSTFYAAVPSSAAARVVVDVSSSGFSLSAYWNALITDPMPVYAPNNPVPSLIPVTNTPVVRLRNQSNFTISVPGSSSTAGPGQDGELWLLARELNPVLFFQGPQGILVTIPPT